MAVTRKPCGGAPVFFLCLQLLFVSLTFPYGCATLLSVFQIKFWFVLHLVSTFLVWPVIVAMTRKLCNGALILCLCFPLFFFYFGFFPMFRVVLCHTNYNCFLTCFLPTLLYELAIVFYCPNYHQQRVRFILYLF